MDEADLDGADAELASLLAALEPEPGELAALLAELDRTFDLSALLAELDRAAPDMTPLLGSNYSTRR
jgi:hypothetical protein